LEGAVVIGSLIVRAVARFVHWMGLRTLLALTLLLLALGSVALGLADLIRGLNTTLALPVAAFGVLLGWVLAKSPLPGWLAGVLAFILGAETLVVSVGRLGRPLTTLLRAPIELAWGGLRWPLDGPPDVSPLSPALAELVEGVSVLLARVRDWLLAVIEGQTAFDPLAAALVWGLALWLAAVWAGWVVRRRQQALQGVAPAGALLTISLSYTWGQPVFLLLLLGVTLPLMVLTRHTARERRWDATGVDFSLELRFELGLAALGLTVALTGAAVLAPSVSVRPIVEWAQRVMVEHLGVGKQVADSMGLEPLAGAGVAFERAAAAGLPNRHLIGSGPELSEQVVMYVYVKGSRSEADRRRSGVEGVSPEPVEGPRYYWRAVTYDHYTGRDWRPPEIEVLAYQAGERATLQTEAQSEAPADSSAHRTLRQEVRAVGNLGGLLHHAGELVTADHDYRVGWRGPGDAFGAEIEATVYQVDSLLPVLGEAQLQSAGDDYPGWVQERYLTLPDGISERVRTLAHDLTAAQPTAYDQARAIERYLRTFTYTLDLPAPPPNRELADYFLFDLQQGFCDYYATTMVVLARAAGLPARLVTGYAPGSYDAQNARYVVTAADAHSWVEVYFPDYGWVEFEPTGGHPEIERPVEVATGLPAPDEALEPLARRRARSLPLLGLGLLGGVTLLALAGAGWWIADDWRLRRLPPAAAMSALYERLYRHGRRLAVPVAKGATPYEFEAGLAERLRTLAQRRHRDEELAFITQDIRRLTDLYVRGLYSEHKPAVAERSQAIKTWRRLRQRLWLVWVWEKTNGRQR
jgi:transglutaminase-like putative cysteine protease